MTWSPIPILSSAAILLVLAGGCSRLCARSSTPSTERPIVVPPPADPSPCLTQPLGGASPLPDPIVLTIPECPGEGDSPCPPHTRAQDDALWSWIEDLRRRIATAERYAARAYRLCGPPEAP
jgi:hypothetical protein